MTTLRWAVADGWTVTRRDLLHWARQPAPVIVGLLFPVLLMLMFAYLFGGAMAVPDGADYTEFLLPGMFGMTMAFGLEATMIAVSTDVRRGVTDRFGPCRWRIRPWSSAGAVPICSTPRPGSPC